TETWPNSWPASDEAGVQISHRSVAPVPQAWWSDNRRRTAAGPNWIHWQLNNDCRLDIFPFDSITVAMETDSDKKAFDVCKFLMVVGAFCQF
ncbi:hypothetical protein BOX15_Mlig027372g3, partial [Macrostomum lignano]